MSDDRAMNLHSARVYLREARARMRYCRGFGFTLLAWAANARRRAASTAPVQGDLFGARS